METLELLIDLVQVVLSLVLVILLFKIRKDRKKEDEE